MARTCQGWSPPDTFCGLLPPRALRADCSSTKNTNYRSFLSFCLWPSHVSASPCSCISWRRDPPCPRLSWHFGSPPLATASPLRSGIGRRRVAAPGASLDSKKGGWSVHIHLLLALPSPSSQTPVWQRLVVGSSRGDVCCMGRGCHHATGGSERWGCWNGAKHVVFYYDRDAKGLFFGCR